jgi:biopolymer transport protein ExbD
MSHGPGGDDHIVEPNLTPMLDLVMQLLMFFIVSAQLKSADKEKAFLAETHTGAAVVEESEEDADPRNLMLSLTLKPFRPDDFERRYEADQLTALRNKFAEKDRDGNPRKDSEGNEVYKNCVLVYNLKTNKRFEKGPQLLDEIGFTLRDIYNETEGRTGATAQVRAEGEVDYASVFRLMQACEGQKYTVHDRTFKRSRKKT